MADDGWLELALDELSRIDDITLPNGKKDPNIAKRKATIIAVVNANLTPGDSESKLFGSRKRREAEKTCGRTIWFTKWKNDPIMASILENVLAIAKKWHSEAQLRQLKKNQDEFRNLTHEASLQVLNKLMQILRLPHVKKTVVGQNGETQIFEPVNFTLGNVAAMLTAANKVGREALEMVPPSVSKIDLTSRNNNVNANLDVDNVASMTPDELDTYINNLETIMALQSDNEDAPEFED